MLTLIKNAEVYSPEAIGKNDILIGGGVILALDKQINLPPSWNNIESVDAEGQYAVPGFVDTHVHITGGGGEGGFHTRTPELQFSDAILGGLTTIVGVIGTDGTTRTMSNLVAKARSLTEEGISCYCLTGNYQIPLNTLTASIEEDLLHIDPIIGVGEIAISDHRSSQPTASEIAKVASSARVGGMLAGKGGIVTVHVGDGKGQLQLLEEVIENTDIPRSQFMPTHLNRNPSLFEAAKTFAKQGGRIDFTTSTVPSSPGEDDITCHFALQECLKAGVPIEQITFTSDAQGSLPKFDEAGDFIGLGIGKVTSLFKAVQDAVLFGAIPLETAIQTITSSPAKAMKLESKGRLETEKDGDVVLLDENLTIDTVIAKGKVMMERKTLRDKGTFEST
ncbi:beta-aspartyl-peptidase [Salsuginibacillus kocurii]|uniref:beta-aspartyl-peptidase n=1 Tax=Salsuginibacillus kocurii TaxID=427078 RepID=UPI000373A2F8|nr:beta-aspartyl-peptidase [Salsuginibacillus kocurii]